MYIIACHVHLNAKSFNFMSHNIDDVLTRRLHILSISMTLAVKIAQILYSFLHKLTIILQLKERIDWDFFLMYHWRFAIVIVSFSFINIPPAPANGVFTSTQYSRSCGYSEDYLDRGLLLANKLLVMIVSQMTFDMFIPTSFFYCDVFVFMSDWSFWLVCVLDW